MIQNGKGDSPRNCFSKAYRDNYDSIFKKEEAEEKGCKCSKKCEKCQSITPRTVPPSGSAPAQHEPTC